MSGIDKSKTEPELIELKDDFIAQLKNINPFVALQELLNSLPSAAGILNSKRQAIFINQFLLNSLGINSFESLFGKKPGEILGCLHALENENQCGISENCRFCGTLQALKQSESTNQIAISEMRLTAIQRGITVARDFKVTISPLILNNNAYMILYLNDISHEKRRLKLERIFFHDVLNKISSLSGIVEILHKKKSIDKTDELMNIAMLIVNDLTSEILSQRQLVAAENGELEVTIGPVNILELLIQLVKQAEQYIGSNNIKINIEQEDRDIKISSDATLLNRVITNMLKNAIEASEKNETVTIKTSVSENSLIIAVHNQSFIPKEIQLQIFHRSFSTKGEDRGLGTYSIKLLTERYLKGKAYFISSDNGGTTFFIKIPVKYGKIFMPKFQ
jgi:signal transduction histidine kinase